MCIRDSHNPDEPHPDRFVNKIPSDRLIPLDMPELDVDPNQPRRIEVYDNRTDVWSEAVIEQIAVDGKVALRFKDFPSEWSWVDLTRVRYRWMVG